MEPRYRIVAPVRFVLLCAVLGGPVTGILVSFPVAAIMARYMMQDGPVGLLAIPVLSAIGGLYLGFIPAALAAVLCILAFGKRRVSTFHVLGVAAPAALLVLAGMFRSALFSHYPAQSLGWFFAAILPTALLCWSVARWTGLAERLPPED